MKEEIIQMDCQIVSGIAVILSIISLICIGLGCVDFGDKKRRGEKRKEIYQKITKGIKVFWNARFTAFHIVSFIILSAYIVWNWEECIDMKLFSEFNGNNILFAGWIVLIFLNMYRVRIKDVEVFERKAQKDLETSFKNAEIKYQIEQAEALQNLND